MKKEIDEDCVETDVDEYWNEDNEKEQDDLIKEYTKKKMKKAMAWS